MIEKKVGSDFLFFYYVFLKEYHREPVDLDDYFTGIGAFEVSLEMKKGEVD